ncbi:MAG: hypothetical protein MUE40_22035, partial [Anaerolineae bacterium]|nr:hypothetical protein [Anaerolineae bacterium]
MLRFLPPDRPGRAAWIVGVGAGSLALLLLLPFVLLAVQPRPAELRETHGETTLWLYTPTGRIGFEGECILLQWDVQRIQAIYLNGRDIPGTGEHYPCVFADRQPTFDIILSDGTTTTVTLPIDILYPGWLRPVLVLLAGVAGGVAVWRLRPARREWLCSGWRQPLTVLALAT